MGTDWRACGRIRRWSLLRGDRPRGQSLGPTVPPLSDRARNSERVWLQGLHIFHALYCPYMPRIGTRGLGSVPGNSCFSCMSLGWLLNLSLASASEITYLIHFTGLRWLSCYIFCKALCNCWLFEVEHRLLPILPQRDAANRDCHSLPRGYKAAEDLNSVTPRAQTHGDAAHRSIEGPDQRGLEDNLSLQRWITVREKGVWYGDL